MIIPRLAPAHFVRVLTGTLIGFMTAPSEPPTHAAPKSEPPTAPFLRIEPGLHPAAINRIAIDAGGKRVATASDDKTIRIWNVSDGALVTTLRIPIDSGDIGALFAVALSPDGKTLVASGRTGLWDGAPVLYLFDVEQQRLKGRLPLSGITNHLAWSPDGRYFAGAFDVGVGVVVWDATNGKLVTQDKDYRGRVAWIAFDRAGRLASASYDGAVRLYDPSFRRIASRSGGSGKQPHAIAFSPDGGLLAVGYADQPRVDVLSGLDLKPRFTPAASDLRQGNLNAVAWNHDGYSLSLVAAGQTVGPDGRMIIRRWRDAGMGAPTDAPLSRDTIAALESLPDGGVIFAGAAPEWGLIRPNGEIAYRRGGVTADFRNVAEGRFGLSYDGLVIDFGLSKGGQRPHRFDFGARRLFAAPPADQVTSPPLTTSTNALRVTDWKDSLAPKLNNRKLILEPDERARSLALHPNGTGFLLGTDYALRWYDAQGLQIAQAPVSGAVWGVAISGNARLAAAALGDGTIRWFSLAVGQELNETAALYPMADGGKWVAWTPEGFFDHSDFGGSKDLVGFHLNEGKGKTPQWVGFAQAYRLFYAPELVAKKLTGGSEDELRARAAGAGDLRAMLSDRPRPGVDLVEYCPIAVASRGFARIAPDAAPTSSAAWPSNPPAAPQQIAAETCSPVTTRQITRGFARIAPDADATSPVASDASSAIPLPPGTSAVRVRVRVTDNGGGVGPVDLLLNSRLVGRETTTRGFARVTPNSTATITPTTNAAPLSASPAQSYVVERVIPLTPGEIGVIQARAYREDGLLSQESGQISFLPPALVANIGERTLTNSAPPTHAPFSRPSNAETAPIPEKPRLLVLSIGIDRYNIANQPRNGRLNNAAKDAKLFVENVRKYSSSFYRQTDVFELYDEQATRSNIEKVFQQLAQTSQGDAPGAVSHFLIYLSGHGVYGSPKGSPLEQQYYAAGVDGYYFITQNTTAFAEMRNQSLSDKQFIELLGNVRAAKIILFLDTCHAGGGVTNEIAAKIGSDIGIEIMAASSSYEEAIDGSEHGLLALALRDGFSGGAARGSDPVINNIDLGVYASNRVSQLFQQEKLAGRAPPNKFSQKAIFKVFESDLQPFPISRPGAQ
ncbi:WD_REPEATS_REGION domain-containing protein [Azospirillaceae bacterium]